MDWGGGGCRVELPDEWGDLMAPIRTRWLDAGTLLGRHDRAYRNRIGRLHNQISAAALDNASMRSVAPQ